MYEDIPPDCEADALELVAESREYHTNPEDLMIQEQVESLLRSNIRFRCSELEGLVICLHHGIYGFSPRSLEQVSYCLHRPKRTIRKAYRRALEKLRELPELR